MTAREAIELIELARSKKLFLMEAMWTRFLPHVAAVNQLIAAGELGDIVAVEADHGQHFDYDPASRWFSPELGVGHSSISGLPGFLCVDAVGDPVENGHDD